MNEISYQHSNKTKWNISNLYLLGKEGGSSSVTRTITAPSDSLAEARSSSATVKRTKVTSI